MKLLIDIGNRRVKWATSDQMEASVSAPTPNDLDKMISDQIVNTHSSERVEQLSRQFKKLPAPESVWVSCVSAASIKTDIVKICKVIWKLSPICIRAEADAMGVENCYENPATVGVDRWAAHIAARHIVGPRPFVVIDAGTAVTIDYVDSGGGFLGGVIFPGVATMIESLNSATGQIQKMTHSYSTKQIPRPIHYVNTNTRSAVENGVMLAVVAGIDQAINHHLATKDSELKVIITGGDAECIAGLSIYDMKYESNLVLLGLRLLSEESAQ